MSALELFTPICRTWFKQNFVSPTPVQEQGWEKIADGQHALLLAPTGSGKTLAAFFFAIDQLMRLPAHAPPGVRVLYISPLKALVHDIERNLRAPLVGCLRAAEAQGHPTRHVRVDMRTGDTLAQDRRRQVREPADILVTTPESLFLLLGGKAAATLAHVHTVIIDEIHALAPTKRGAHLALSLERLEAICSAPPQRIGLSATVRPATQVAQYLAGARPVAVVDQSCPPRLTLRICVPTAEPTAAPPAQGDPPLAQADSTPHPVAAATSDAYADAGHLADDSTAKGTALVEGGGSILGQIARANRSAPPQEAGGMWRAVAAELLRLILEGRATLVFVNSRSLCERLADRLNELAGTTLVRAHHGSLSHAKRRDIEEALKEGQLRGIVATSSLELGIDMGSLDLVALVESPGSVARGLQRVGRAGHAVGQISHGIIFPKFRGDLIESTVIGARMREGLVEAIDVPHNALDVLAQQLVAMCVVAPMHLDALLARVQQAYPYHALSRNLLVAVLDMLSGAYPSDAFAELRPLLRWDRSTDMLSGRPAARLVTVLNAGTIPDRGTFGVFLGHEGPRVGELDEEMVHESRRGDTFLLGASTWRIEAITPDRVVVSPAPGEPGKLPFWRGEGPGRPVELGGAIGAFLRRLSGLSPGAAHATLRDAFGLDPHAAHNLFAHVREQLDAIGTLPTDRSITIERFADALGDWRVCILTPWGARVHGPWAMALEHRLSTRRGEAVHAIYNDDGIVLRVASESALPELQDLLFDADEVEEYVVAQLAQSAVFASLFRENASRALLLPRRAGARRTPLWQQRLRAKTLMAAAQPFGQFPIIQETYRCCLKNLFDMQALRTLFTDIGRQAVQVVEVQTQVPSPFARGLAYAYVATYLYENDAPAAERRAQALTLDRDMLRELLGEVALRDLLDAAVIEAVEAELQHMAPGHRARNADEVHDLLRRLGDLSEAEVIARCEPDDTDVTAHPDADAVPAAAHGALPKSWLAILLQERRILHGPIAGQMRYIATEDAGRYRDAVGFMPPGGLPARFLDNEAAPLVRFVQRWARTHTPFVAQQVAARLNLLPAQVAPALQLLQAQGTLVCGAMLPGQNGEQWCDADVLRRLRRQTLSKLRHAVAAVDSRALVRFLPQWHHVGAPRTGMQALEECLVQLEGVPLPFSALSEAILPARIAQFHLDMLDMLCATGSIVWMGQGAIGPRDGRIILVRRSHASQLLSAPSPIADDQVLHRAVLAHLQQRGACFTVELMQCAPLLKQADLETVLWELVWAGHITNDTMQPLRGLRHGPRRGRRHQPPRFGGRWSKVEALLDGAPRDTGPEPTQRAHARAHSLLQRYGIISREAALAEGLTGGFAAIYPILRAMEEAGRIRRGYFVEGLSGLQFAYATALERLRHDEAEAGQLASSAMGPASTTVLLAAVDPANPFGALLPWPTPGPEGSTRPPDEGSAAPEATGKTRPAAQRRLRRQPGAWVGLCDGELLFYLEANGHNLHTFCAAWQSAATLGRAVAALGELARRRPGRSLNLRTIDQVPSLQHPRLAELLHHGAATTFDGVTLTPRPQGEVGDARGRHAL